MLITRRNPRRGVLLLVVMALLALMATVTMTFVLVTGVQMRSARSSALSNQETDSPEDFLDGALDQVLRGAEDPSSPIWTHSLLEDLYGHDTVLGPNTGVMKSAPNDLGSGGGGLIELYLTFDNRRTAEPAHPSSDVGFYDGRLITMLTGPTAGVTRRIVRSTTPATGGGDTYTLQVQSFGGGLPQIGDRFIINGRPFDGTGFGLGLSAALTGVQQIADGTFDKTIDHKISVAGSMQPRALLPNHGSVANSNADLFDAQYPDPTGLGRANEDYDAADYQNMHLAVMVADPNTPILGTKVIRPSYHDPALINYWENLIKNDPTLMAAAPAAIRDLRRKFTFRPSTEDHPGFATVNPTFNPIIGPWDVDNDNNGKPDSVWVDLGSPVQTDASGRLYKPMYAILCLDMDGRLNLNAHGSPMHLVRTGATWPPKQRFVGPFADMQGEAMLPIGQGYGPADIVLNRLFMSGAPVAMIPTQPHDLYYLMHGNPDKYFDGTNVKVAGRYGESHLLDIALDRPPMPGRTTQWVPGTWGVDGRDDDLDGVADDYSDKLTTEISNGGMYDDNFPPTPIGEIDPFDKAPASESGGNMAAYLTHDGTNPHGLFGSPADLDGDGGVALDLTGNPIYASHGEGDDAIDDPYELDLTMNGSQRRKGAVNPPTAGDLADADAPFTPADLEVLLRMYDADVGTLYSRLFALAPDTFVNQTAAQREFLRGIFTTESWDAPTTNRLWGMPEMGTVYSPYKVSGTNLLTNVMTGYGLPVADQPKAFRRYLYPQFFDGLKLNINRPLGNGVDDDTDGIVDEPGELDPLWTDLLSPGIRFDADNDGAAHAAMAMSDELIVQSNAARQAMARHLYMLAMTLRNQFVDDVVITERELAQWAVNAVDFRDRDSIMTGFEYDAKPFDANGWSVDGNLATDEGGDRGVVWGVERPELLITETIAGHDRGTDDTSNDTATSDVMAGMGADTDYDQVARPDGWVMIELYNPQQRTATPSRPPSAQMITPETPPAELYDATGLIAGDGLWLSREAPNNSPVWRIAIGQPSVTTHPKPTDDERKDPVLDTTKIERTVYLKEPRGAITGGVVKYFSSSAAEVSVAPGGYVVIGSSGVDLDGNPTSVTEIGRGLGAADQPKIDLNVSPPAPQDPTMPLVLAGSISMGVEDDGMQTPYPILSSGDPSSTDEEIVPPVAVQIDMPRRLSISEPTDGYDQAPFVIGDIANYGTPWDEAEVPQEPWVAEVGKGTTNEAKTEKLVAYNRVYLQRLANPTLEWDENSNPYLTVDSMPVDLWTYNSSADADGASAMPEAIRSRERLGDSTDEDTQDAKFNIWRQWAGDVTPGLVPHDDPNNGPKPNKTTHPSLKLQHTLGYLNSVWHTGASPDHRWWTPAEFAKTANVDALGSGVGVPQRLYELAYFIGRPLTPAPWLTWNNRPYISKYELMMVPKSNSSELLAQYSVRATGTDPYTVEEGDYSAKYEPTATTATSHLINFFYHSDKSGVGQRNHDLYRIFDFVDVPSRFSGTEEMIHPNAFESPDQASAADPIFGWNQGSPAQRNLAPPFNYLSNYREPGKVNLNTIFDDGSTWRAMLGGFDGYSGAPTWEKLQKSRRGYNYATPVLDPTSGNPNLDVNTPALMARPFRSFSGGYFVPTPELQHEGIESTLLRSDSDPGVTPKQPLFALNSATTNTDSDNNPYFRYQLLNRLSNMVTTRSNVYAVWITVGYFEVEPVDRSEYLAPTGNYTAAELDRVFPDGYRLKGELGADTGDIERHRAFYLIDRLVPVAFERGKTHNTRKAIRLRTIIE